MTDLSAQKDEANRLRKDKQLDEALPIYRMLWEKSGDKYDGCGLLHCLRNLKILDEAIILADELIVRYPDFNWCRIEVIWTYIQGKLLALGEKESLGKVKEVADQITSLNPDTLALKTVVFTVIKHAKSSNNWQIVNEWIVKLDPNALDSNPPNDSLKKQEWSDQERWYNYRISGLLEKWDSREQLEKALQLTDEALSHFTEHKKFFLRLKALGYHKLGDLSEAKKQYQSLCSGHNTDWWLLHEYANVVKDMGVAPEALALMCKAALSQAPLKAKVTLIRDIGMLCKDMGNNEAARAHLILAKQVREEQGWSIPEVITATISSLNRILGDEKSLSMRESLKLCQNEWLKFSPKENSWSQTRRAKRNGLMGNVSLGRAENAFAFIVTKDEQVFCFKSDLPNDVKDGDKVTFDAIPSFDNKKNKESWKASNIQPVENSA